MRTAHCIALLAAALLGGCGRKPPPDLAAPAASAPAASAASAVPAIVPVPVPPASEVQASAADIEAGSRLAAQGAGAAAACSSCHGPHGEGQAAARFPRLAGLGAVYLREQLDSYADGRRQHPVMEPIAKALQVDQRRQAAAYFASLEVPPTPAPTRPAPADTPASRLALLGDEARQLPACANCHGRDGGGLGDSIPPLAGQPAGYLEDSLAAWREGRRNNDPSGQMPRIAQALGPADAQALAAWFGALPAPAAANRRPPAFASSLPAVNSGPVAAANPPQGTGTEQGAPLTGGGIGPGGAGATQQPAGASRPQ
ncbi:MAG TPA: c-type cytochrome [Roseateles sp.]